MTLTPSCLLGAIMNSANGHFITVVFIADTADLQGCGHRILSGGVGMSESQSEGTVQRCDVRDLSTPPLLG